MSDFSSSVECPSRPRGPLALGEWALNRTLTHLKAGHFVITLPTGAQLSFQGPAPGPSAHLYIRNWRTLRRLVREGDIGFARSYLDGDWTSPDIARLLELACLNAQAMRGWRTGSDLMRVVHRALHWRRRNTVSNSRQNISEHYDLGNAFYKAWLDTSMTYSSAVFHEGDETLELAQARKLDRIADRLALRGGERVMEIGCGWGALAEKLARDHCCHVTALTLSREQKALAQERLQMAGLAQSTDIRLEDYRQADGQYDRLVSVEMIEAVGERYWPLYFQTIYDRLKPGGVAVIQAITMGEDHFEDYRRRPDFIQRFVFPGGMLPSRTSIIRQAQRAGLNLVDTEFFGQSYARTLAEWSARFLKSWADIQTLGFDERFRRLWLYYLSYCEAGFRAGVTDVGLYRFKRG